MWDFMEAFMRFMLTLSKIEEMLRAFATSSPSVDIGFDEFMHVSNAYNRFLVTISLSADTSQMWTDLMRPQK